MDIRFSAQDEAFREEVRRFLDEKLTEDLREAGRLTGGVYTDAPINRRWHRILFEQGWAAPSWPVEYGGTGWSVVQQYIFATEVSKANAPRISANGLRQVAHVIMHFGTPEQKAFYLPRILSAEDYWCQGYSEPGAGSDLAALQCKAVSDGDDYVINGTKIWTTHAQWANRMYCLVRTSSAGKPQEGITFLILDMNTPGITIRPLITLAGDHEVNQVFFDNVRVPKKNRMGEENKGWTVAKFLLEFERGGAYASGMRSELERVRALARSTRSSGDSLADDPAFAREAAALDIAISVAEFTEHRVMAELSRSKSPGPASSMLKVQGSELGQRISELGIDVIAFYGAPFQPEVRVLHSNVDVIGPREGLAVMPRYLNARASTIYAGSNEVQRNLMAKLVLGL